MAIDQAHAVSNTTGDLNQQGAAPLKEGERTISSKEHFQTFLNPTATSPTQSIDPRSIPIEAEADIVNSPTLGDDNVTPQKSGSSTDDQQKRKQQEQAEEIEEVSATKEKTQDSSSQEKTQRTEKTAVEAASSEGIQHDVQNALTHIDKAKKRLSEPGTKVKPSYQTIIRNRLGHIDENIKIALSKTGIENTPAPTEVKSKTSHNPVTRFIDSFTQSENSLHQIQDEVKKLSETNSINPATLLAVQIKVGYIQQQIEFLTNLLNKALESTKTIMNVQV